MSLRLPSLALLAAPLLGALAACQAPPPRVSGGGGAAGPSDPSTAAYCRQQAEDVFNAQNRSARLQVNTYDSPFSGGPAPVSATRGLSDRFSMDMMISDCMRNAASRQAGPDVGTAPVQGQAATQSAAQRPANRLPSGPAGGPPISATNAVAPAAAPLERAPPPPAPVRP